MLVTVTWPTDKLIVDWLFVAELKGWREGGEHGRLCWENVATLGPSNNLGTSQPGHSSASGPKKQAILTLVWPLS